MCQLHPSVSALPLDRSHGGEVEHCWGAVVTRLFDVIAGKNDAVRPQGHLSATEEQEALVIII